MRRVWQESKGCSSYSIPEATLSQIFNVKLYAGCSKTDVPEFSEVDQIPLSLSALMSTESDLLQFKVNLDESTEAHFPGLAEDSIAAARRFVSAHPLRVNMRIAGANWKFPMHFDAVDQIILHHSGVKRWRILDRWWVCRPGDVLYIQAGVWHSVENDAEHGACMISNVQFLNRTSCRLDGRFLDLYVRRAEALEANKDAFTCESQ